MPGEAMPTGNAPGHAHRSAAGDALPDQLSRLLARPDLRIAPHERSIRFAPGLSEPFSVDRAGHIRLGPGSLSRGEPGATLLRHALELALLLPRLPSSPALAGLAAARTAALFAVLNGGRIAAWQLPLADPTPPDAASLQRIWTRLARLQPGAPARLDGGVEAVLARSWSLIGPTEILLQTGGDQRLRVDPATGLNGYGCSHRPRPWAVTFASSTASSSSERGFAAAEAARQRVTLAALTGATADALATEAGSVRADMAALLQLPPGTGVVLAASGTDCELLALALAAADLPPGQTITNLLIAPEETGSGVPLAASFCHFAPDTARGDQVTKGARIDGLPHTVAVTRVAARDADGDLKPAREIDAACAAAADAAIGQGHAVVAHLLDLSKTGYLAPSVESLAALTARHSDRVRVVVDACQFRLTPARIAAYLAQDWFVLITGSKFLTGPPFAGAILVPPRRHAALAVPLPAGLAAYSSRPEWPECTAAAALPETANYGLLLRWQAAIAELRALLAVPPERQRDILLRFCTRLREGIAANPDVRLVEVARPHRPDRGWDDVQTIVSFSVRPASPLGPADARRLYHWLNADIRPGLPRLLTAEAERLACLRCHIGQPVPLPGPDGREIGVLRISAGARLVSGEPSHHDLDEDSRLLREIGDALSVLAKISLILPHWDQLLQADAKPSF